VSHKEAISECGGEVRPSEKGANGARCEPQEKIKKKTTLQRIIPENGFYGLGRSERDRSCGHRRLLASCLKDLTKGGEREKKNLRRGGNLQSRSVHLINRRSTIAEPNARGLGNWEKYWRRKQDPKFQEKKRYYKNPVWFAKEHEGLHGALLLKRHSVYGPNREGGGKKPQ